MSWPAAVMLGIVQGITECLPVSSSAHLVFAEKILGIKSQGVSVEVFLHLGTMAAAVMFFRGRWAAILSRPLDRGSLRYIGFLFLGTIPAAIAGYLAGEVISESFHKMRLVSFDLLIYGVFLTAAGGWNAGRKEMGWGRALIVGMAQSIALLPGISRSGMTVGSGLLAGLERARAVEFSFMLSVPAILGASVLELRHVAVSGPVYGTGCLAAAGAASFVSGYIAIGLLLRIVERGRLAWFGYYCLALGAGGLICG